MTYTRENVTPEAIMGLWERADETQRGAAELKRTIQEWQRRRDPAALDVILAKLNEAEHG